MTSELMMKLRWWEVNTLLYGSDLNQIYQVVKQSILLLNQGKSLHASMQSIQNGNAYVRSTKIHQEFDFSACYNVAAIAACIAQVRNIASYKRIDAKRYVLFLHAINNLGVNFINQLKSIVELFSDRTCFVLTTSNVGSVPKSLLFNCTPLRVSQHRIITLSQSVMDEQLSSIIDKVFSVPTNKLNDVFICFRNFAYKCIGFNIRFAFVAKRLITILIQRTQPNLLNQICEVCARNEASTCVMKKDILAWELAFMEIVQILTSSCE